MTALGRALRSLRLAPAFTLTVIATLAVGIGLNAVIFTVVDQVLLRPLGYRDADRIVGIQTHFTDENRSIPRVGGDDYSDLERQVHGLASVAHYASDAEGIRMNGQAFYLTAAAVSPRFTQVMGVEPLADRLLNPAAADGTDALVSALFAREHFSSPAAALGQSITAGEHLYTVVGVLPEGFSFPGKTQVWFELPARPQFAARDSYSERVVGKRRDGVSEAALRAELATFSARLSASYAEDRHKTIEAVPLKEQIVGKVRPTLHLLVGAVLVLLAIVCANLTHMLLVRATLTRRAVSVRTALGASRGALAASALLETGLLALAGTALAIALAVPTLSLLVSLAPPELPRLGEVSLDLQAVGFALAVALGVMLLATLLPLWRSWQVNPAEALRSDRSRGTEAKGSVRLRGVLVIAETALTLTLSVTALLLARALIAESHQDLGFRPEHLLTVDLRTVMPGAAGPDHKETGAEQQKRDAAAVPATLARLNSTLDAAASVPGVNGVAAVAGAPTFIGSDINYAVEGKQHFGPGERLPNAEIRPVTPGYFSLLGIPLLRGRDFTAGDGPEAPRVVLINQALARASFPGMNPVGHRIQSGFDADAEHGWTIVGVVGDTRNEAPGLPPEPFFYVPVAQHAFAARELQLMVRTAADPALLSEMLRTRLNQTHPESAVKMTTMTENIGRVERPEQFRAALFSLFAAVSVALAALGLYGVAAYTVAQRRFEFGLRLALGSSRTLLLGRVLGAMLTMTLAGVAVGMGLSLALGKLLASVVGTLPAFDATAYLLAALLVLLLASLATLLPARRAAGLEPMSILRGE